MSGHVPDHRIRVAAHGVQLSVRVVLRDTPDAVALVPECRPGQVLGEERGDPGGGVGGGEIRAGQWTPGNAVPSRNQLAERFGIARETAARAYAWLARAGYLVAVPGVGVVVTPVNRWPEEAS